MSVAVEFHRKTSSDLKEIFTHYQHEAGFELADRFYDEFLTTVNRIAENPAYYPRYNSTLRRANLRRFPYHLLYEMRLASCWVTVVRHNKRDPSYGLRRS